MSETITSENAPSHIQKLYHYVGVLARNHNQIIDHLKEIHKNVTGLHQNVKALRETIKTDPAKVNPPRVRSPERSNL